jgi:hypothetical protein
MIALCLPSLTMRNYLSPAGGRAQKVGASIGRCDHNARHSLHERIR